VITRPLEYVTGLQKRDVSDIELVVIHCTELPDLATAREFGQRIHHTGSQTGNSGHFYIDRDGTTEQWVPIDRVAHHVRGFNENSIGIELVNTGRFPDWFNSRNQQMTEAYPNAQLSALVQLLTSVQKLLSGIKLRIAGHEALDTELLPASDNPKIMVRRKCDPGPMFPWDRVLTDTGIELYQPALR
jgi:N-acetylmuramoyl-L-alanine amidase